MSSMTMNTCVDMLGIHGGSDDPCILGLTNGTYPNGTIGRGTWTPFRIYMPTAAEKTACQNANDPWSETAYYGWWTTCFILAGLAAVATVNGVKRFHNLNRIMGFPSIASFNPKISALFRFGSYPQLRLLSGTIPPLGPSTFIIGFLLFATGVTFLRKPYYRPPHYGSPPLALRSQWVATAMVPWIYAAATKRNFLAFFTGIHFQRVMTFHKWTPWICLFMSIVHASAMIVKANRQEPWWYTIQRTKQYWNGFPALAALTWLCVMSLRPVRARFYETFYFFHIVAAIFFLIWLYIHLDNELNSWQYLHATTVLWGAGVAWRVLAYALDHVWFMRIFRASIQAVPADGILIRVPMPSNRTWSAGSHVYLRFPGIRPWESHPFTISSLPAPPLRSISEKSAFSEKHEMVFLIKPCGGITARLRSLAYTSAAPMMRACLVDGPYGGSMGSLRACDAVVLIAGGSGMSAIIPVAQALTRSGAIKGMSCCQNIEVCWTIRDLGALEWFKDQLSEIYNVSVHVTNPNFERIRNPSLQSAVASDIQAISPDRSPKINSGRPDLALLLGNAVKRHVGRIGVLVCGPHSMVLKVRNTVANLQKSILFAEPTVKCQELELYEESFRM